MSADRGVQLRETLANQAVSGYSPAVLQHQGIRVLAESESDSMGDLTNAQITAFAILRAYHEFVPIPRTMRFIENYISLSRARDRKGRLEYSGCYKSYPGYVVHPGGFPTTPEQKPGLLSQITTKLRKKDDD